MNEVYCVFRAVDYEGENILDIFASEESALKFMHEYAKSCDNDYYRWSWHETDQKYEGGSVTIYFQKYEVQP